MKFVKHFIDSHDSPMMQSIFNLDGHRGVACYWILVEMCTAAMNKDRDQEWSESDCKFVFHERVLRQKLRVSQTNLRKILGIFQENVGLLWVFVGEKCEIEFPKLLEILHRDAKRTRPGRVRCAPNKEKDNNNNNNTARARAALESIFREFPRREGKSEGIRLGEEELRTEEDFSDLRKAVKNYAAKCQDDQTEHAFIKTFATFMREWRDWTDPKYGRKPKPNYSNEAW